jgi:hypothetical protein
MFAVILLAIPPAILQDRLLRDQTGLQKVSAQLELNKLAPQVASDNQ